MTYPEALDYIFSKLPMFSRVGSEAIKTGLKNINLINQFLGHPEKKGKCIHVAGTNGKGSVSHMLAAVLQKAGYKTGLYTSPHLKDVRERIKINGKMMSEDDLVSFIKKNQPIIEYIKPSFFEINVAMAFDHFAKYETDISIIETGLGGRLDSTNVIDPLISVITNIGYDHMKILGATLPEIAAEKAGIIKPAIPVVIGEFNPETAPVFEKTALDKNASLSFASKEFTVGNWSIADEYLNIEIGRAHHVDHQRYSLDLTGIYQTKNVLTVLETIHQLNQSGAGISVDENAIHEGLKHTKSLTELRGRWEVIHRQPKIVLDVAHNPDGIKQILEQLEITNYNKLHVVIGMVADKDVDTVLSLMPKNASYYFTNSGVPRAMLCEDLKIKASLFKLKGDCHHDVNEALHAARSKADTDDLILVCGSVFLIGEVENI